MKKDYFWFFSLLSGLTLLLAGCVPRAGNEPQTATVMVTLDMGSGGAGFAATVYAQEVNTGKTFFAPYAAGSHGLVVLPTSAPVGIVVEAPGTYVVYARLVNEPDSYHYGATGFRPATECADSSLLAVAVEPGQVVDVTLADRAARLPERDQPVSVPWRLAGEED